MTTACKGETASVSPSQTECPEPPPVVTPTASPAVADEAPPAVDSAHEDEEMVRLPWGFIESQQLRPRTVDDLLVTVTAESADESDEPPIEMQVQIADADGQIASLRARMDDVDCGGVFTTFAGSLGYFEGAVLEVRLECSVGVESVRWRAGHMFVHVDEDARTAKLLHSGTSHRHEKLEVHANGSFLRANIEGSTLAVHEETEAWCDPEAWTAVHDKSNAKCRYRPRKLKKKARIPLH